MVATAKRGLVRALAVRSTCVVEEARIRHDTLPTATAALGRSLTAALLMGASLKSGQTVTLRVVGDGPIGAIVADADAEGHVRGYVKNPKVDLPLTPEGKLNVSAAVGRNGFIYVSKDLGLKEPYVGSAPLVSGEIAEDLSHYFAVSEQTRTAVALGVLVSPDNSVAAAGGYLLELLPGATEETAEAIESNLKGMAGVSRLIESGLLPEDILQICLEGEFVSFHEKRPVEYKCRCSRDRALGALILLGREELSRIWEAEGASELTCRFCNSRYRFTKAEVASLLEYSHPQLLSRARKQYRGRA